MTGAAEPERPEGRQSSLASLREELESTKGRLQIFTDALDAMFEAAKTPPTGKLIKLKESRQG